MIELTYNGVTLTEHNLFSVKTRTTKAMVAESLEWDTISSEFCVWPDDNFPAGWTDINENSEIVLDVDGEISLYYPSKVEPVVPEIFALEGISIVGLLAEQQFEGKLYVTGDTVGDVLADIMGSYSYTVDQDIADLPAEGYLPRSDKREALRQILGPYGISLMKDGNGEPYFTYNQPSTAHQIEDARIEVAGKITRETPATEIQLVEHTFTPSSAAPTETFFDNSSATEDAISEPITFDEPIQVTTLATTGTLTIDSSSINLVVVSGRGTLTGKRYLHSRRLLSASTGVTGRDNVIYIDDMWMVNPINSLYALARFASYKSKSTHFTRSIYTNEYIRSGEMLYLKDPLRNMTRGFVKTCETDYSTDSMSECDIIADWFPDNLGTFNDYAIVTQDTDIYNYCVANNINVSLADPVSGLLTVSGLEGKPVRIVMFSGMQGGTGGSAGSPGESSQPRWYPKTYGETGDWLNPNNFEALAGYYLGYAMNGGKGGKGGQGGAGGKGGKAGRIKTVDVVSCPAYMVFAFGAGGNGGDGGRWTRSNNASLTPLAHLPEDGDLGADSTVNVSGTVYTTQGAQDLDDPYFNAITGDLIVPIEGAAGVAGFAGTNGGPSKAYVLDDNPTYDYSAEGKADGADGTVGLVGNDLYDSRLGKYWHYPLLGGVGQGGPSADSAVYGVGTGQTLVEVANFVDDSVAPNKKAKQMATGKSELVAGQYVYTGGEGGAGGNAHSKNSTRAIFAPGEGGNGGGGGGGAGSVCGWGGEDAALFAYNKLFHGLCLGGLGGRGGRGQKGSNGFAIIYFQNPIL